METRNTIIGCMALFCSAGIIAQNSPASFCHASENMCRLAHKTALTSRSDFQENTILGMENGVKESLPISESNLSRLTVAQLKVLIADLVKGKENKEGMHLHNSSILSYYEGESHTLSLENLKAVIEEVGLSNQLFVLAQAVLETGNFTSYICNNYHNLFGLYDSKHKDYYRFSRWEDSVVGYQKFIQYRYKGGNYLQFLHRIGYAKDSNYTTKVAKIATQVYKKLFNSP